MKLILFALATLVVLSLLGVYYIIISHDPSTAKSGVFYFLYGNILVFITSLIGLFLYWFRLNRSTKESKVGLLWPSIRQGFLIGSTLTVILILHTLGVLTYWDAIPIILAFVFLEFFFQSSKLKDKLNE